MARKRGASSITIIRAFGIAMAAFIIILLVNYWREVKDNTFLEKTYLARDIGLLLTAVYASPGELSYCYYNVAIFAGLKFEYEIGNSVVSVKDAQNEVTYRYVEDAKQPLAPVKASYVKDKPLKALLIMKENGIVKIIPKREGDDPAPCQP